MSVFRNSASQYDKSIDFGKQGVAGRMLENIVAIDLMRPGYFGG
jgi:hypothetical protein